ncbi:Hypothetical protein A7982_01754 [Minicystis rosea]|nr:Hypothetical protein A7982_01754 [Minicystis rosea]
MIPSAPPSASAAPEPPRDPLAALRARGSFHTEPIHVVAEERVPEQWIVMLGSPAAARAAWRVRREGPPEPLRGWPDGVRVLGARRAHDAVYVLIETLAVLGQPAGLRAAVRVPLAPEVGTLEGAPLGRTLPAVDVRDLSALDARLAAPSHPADGSAAVELAERLLRDAKSVIPSGGLVYGRHWQRTFLEPRERIDAGVLARRPETKRIVEALRALDPSAPDALEGGLVFTRSEAGREVIDAFYDLAEPAPPRDDARRVVSGYAVTAESMALFREQIPGELVPIAEAAWGERGSVSIAADPEQHTALAMFREGDFVHVSQLHERPTGASLVEAERFTAAFADVDGDGRTDVVLRGDGGDRPHTWVFLTPAALPPSNLDLAADAASAPWVYAAKTADEAATALVRAPARVAKAAEVRRLLGGPTPPHVYYFRESEEHAGIVETTGRDADDWWKTRARCGGYGHLGCELRCDRRRPVCQSLERSGSTRLPYREAYYWPAWIGGRLRLHAAAFASDGTPTAW